MHRSNRISILSPWLAALRSRLFRGIISGLLGSMVSCGSSGPSGVVSGTVVDADGPVVGARVRVRATDNLTYTDAEGTFTLTAVTEGEETEVTAWADGYYIASTFVTSPIADVALTLHPYHTADHSDYEWTLPIPGTSGKACGNHHFAILPQWMNNAHAHAVDNPRFFSLYNGTDASGSVEVGPGYRKDFPSTAGNCANCHAPAAAVDGYLTTDMNTVRGVVTAGIHCDYCHKVGGVYLDPATQSVYPNSPGVRSQRVLRPPAGNNIFFGPYDDVPEPDTYLPAIRESAFCAPCHQFSMWGTPIYQSYEEWLASPYAADGITCQSCHMPPTGDSYFVLPEAGGLEHPPERIPSHLQLGASDVELLQGSVTMKVHAGQINGRIEVAVAITNSGTGHHVPTDYPGRHMILVVAATDEEGRILSAADGPTVPEWGGRQAGLPGTAFAKVLRDVETGDSPVVSYWKRTVIAADNRIAAGATDTSDYVFAAPDRGGEVQVTVRLIFRRLYQKLADEKGWDLPDILMKETSLTISP